MHTRPLKLFLTAAVPLLLFSLVEVTPRASSLASSFNLGKVVLAKSSGGRSQGGSFRTKPRSPGQPSSPNRSQSDSPTQQPPQKKRTNSSQFNNNRPYNDPYYNRPYNDPYYNRPGGGTVVIPVPGTGTVPNRANSGVANQSAAQPNWLLWSLLLGIPTAIVLFIAFRKLRGAAAPENVLENDTVTVSKVQVALLAQARQIQSELSNLIENYDPNTPEGLLQQLQESALALLRTPENWTHVLASSQVVKDRESAEELFNQLAIEERSKFSVESLVRVGGKISRQQVQLDPDEAPASYIVVTLLVGTAHDQPLFDSIRTTEDLQAALEKIAALPADYLMVFALLWSPQEATDSLTYDELLTEYSDMVQL